MKLLAGPFQFTFPRPVLVMGIVNATPDSFSDGGKFLDPAAAIEHALRLARQGADIIDIGGESSRPGAAPVSEEEELRRVIPVIEGLADQLGIPISIDTMKGEVARKALKAGATIVNDVGANRNDPAMWRVLAETGAAYVCVHMQGTPQTMQSQPAYADVVNEIKDFFSERMKRLNQAGVQPEQIVLDPGIGFGKTPEHNLRLLGSLRSFTELQRPLLVGVSRKSFISKLLGSAPTAPLNGSLACACLAAEAGVQIVRAHDVLETVQALRMTEAILANRA